MSATHTLPVPSARTRTGAPPSRRRMRAAVAVALIGVLGISLATYPSIAGWFSQLRQSELIAQYGTRFDVAADTSNDAEITAAVEYNRALQSGVLLAPGANVPTGSGSGGERWDYDSLLRAGVDGMMARIRIPAINVDLPIYHGTDELTLARGVGHLQGSSLPIGGPSTHSVLTAHRGLAESELFTNLDRVELGDTFTIEVFGEVLTYRVRDVRVVLPTDTASLFSQPGEDLVTLVTCTPLGINSHRILVTGERILPTPAADLAAAGEAPDIPGFPWWSLVLGFALASAGVYVWWAAKAPARPLRDEARDIRID